MELNLIGTDNKGFVYEDGNNNSCVISTGKEPFTFVIKSKAQNILDNATAILNEFAEMAFSMDDKELEEKIQKIVV